MSLVLNLTPQLERQLTAETKRDGIAPKERAELLLRLAVALRNGGSGTPFDFAVKEFFRNQQVDPDRLAWALDLLMGICVPVTVHPARPTSSDANLGASIERVRLVSSLRRWRDEPVPRPTDEATTIPSEVISPRPSILGKYAHLGLSSEDFMREKQEEIDREDRRSWE